MATTTKKKRQEKMAPPNILNVGFVWDMSGSMGLVADASREGTTGYIADLQKEEARLSAEHGDGVYTRFSLTIFNTRFERRYTDVPITDVSVEDLAASYVPAGGTALYDAIANTIAELDASLRASGRENEKCLIIIMTDGQENSSIEYNRQQNGRQRLFDLIHGFEAKGNWTFVYLGANVDAYAEASAIGLAQGSTAYFSTDSASMASAYGSLTAVSQKLRTGDRASTTTPFADAGQTQDYRATKDAASAEKS